MSFKGVAVDLESGRVFPASFEWNNFEDMTSQIKNMALRFFLLSSSSFPLLQHTHVLFPGGEGKAKKEFAKKGFRSQNFPLSNQNLFAIPPQQTTNKQPENITKSKN